MFDTSCVSFEQIFDPQDQVKEKFNKHKEMKEYEDSPQARGKKKFKSIARKNKLKPSISIEIATKIVSFKSIGNSEDFKFKRKKHLNCAFKEFKTFSHL